MEPTKDGAEPREVAERLPLSGWIVIAAAYLLVPLVLLAAGRDAAWWQAWLFSLVVNVAGIGGRVWAEHRHPGLQADRMKLGRGQQPKRWDRVLSPLMGFSVLYIPVIIAALDHRYAWTAPFPAWVNILGVVLCAVGYWIAVWALAENRFFTLMVRIQTERGHEVCDTGPYRFVRHPGYAGNLLSLVGIPLALDSAWAALACGFALVISFIRTALEDRTLIEELPKYDEYAQRVRSRLLPGIW